MRYDAVFLMECLLLKMKSTAAYKHLRKNRMLPLPSPSTIRRYLSASDCYFGFNEMALDHIKKALEGLPVPDRFGSLMWDEMAVKKDITWDAFKLEWHGIDDFGKDVDTQVGDGIADHVLVLMFQPYKSNWVQPFACFASKGTASGVILHEIITKAICTLYRHNAIVKNTVCDGCQSNKSAMNLFGVCGKSPCKPSFIHPLDPSSKIYHVYDPPHLLKCVRNQIHSHRRVQVL